MRGIGSKWGDTGRDWETLGRGFGGEYRGLHWFVLVCTGLYWFELARSGLNQFVVHYTGPYWFPRSPDPSPRAGPPKQRWNIGTPWSPTAKRVRGGGDLGCPWGDLGCPQGGGGPVTPPEVTLWGRSHGGAAAPPVQPPLRRGRLVPVVGEGGGLQPPRAGEEGERTWGAPKNTWGGVKSTLGTPKTPGGPQKHLGAPKNLP